MSTLQHRITHPSLWWYAAAAVLAALVAVLAVNVLGNAGSATPTDTGPVVLTGGHAGAWHPGPACFATRHGAPPELAGNCVTHAP